MVDGYVRLLTLKTKPYNPIVLAYDAERLAEFSGRLYIRVSFEVAASLGIRGDGRASGFY